MAKNIKARLKLAIDAGKANPAPPIGPALGQHGINIADFCKQFNDRTKEMMGDIIPADLIIYEDRSFTFTLGAPLVTSLLRNAAKVEKGSAEPSKKKVGTVTKQQIRDIAQRKMADLNATNVETAMKIVEGSARSMGIDIKD